MLEISYIMSNIEKVTKIRYQKVIDSLKEDYIVKSIVSTFLWLVAVLQDMFSTNVELLLLLIIVICVDWITGNINARRKGIQILSFGYRQSIVKVLEYTLFLLVLTGIANVFSSIEGTGWVADVFKATKNIEVFGYFYIILTELKSIAENISGKEGTLSDLFKEIRNKIMNED